MTPCVLLDLDGTLCDVRHRLHHVRKSPPDWPAFFDACVDDPPHPEVVELVRILYKNGSAIFFCSGRPDTHRQQTWAWIGKHVGNDIAWGVPLLMRKGNDHRPDTIVKKEMLDYIRGAGYEPMFAIDDRPSIVKMWRENGVPCFAVDDAEWQKPQSYFTTDHEGKTLLTLMVGPSGAGKSSWLDLDDGYFHYKAHAHEFGIRAQHILSSDQFRAELLGDWRDQSDNARVFTALHDVARTRLNHGLPTVIDATHLKHKDRLASVDLAPVGTRVRYVVMDRPLEEKILDAQTPKSVIRKHDRVFRSQIKDILAGDGLPQVDVLDLRQS